MRDGERVSMSPRVFDLLLVLVENAGRLVSKETLMSQVWADSFVEEGNLNQTVSRLRRVLGDTPNETRFIETVPRIGYRFIAPVELVEDGTSDVARSVPIQSVDQVDDEPLPAATLWRRWLLVPVALAVVGGGVA